VSSRKIPVRRIVIILITHPALGRPAVELLISCHARRFMLRFRGLPLILILPCFLAVFLAGFAKAMRTDVQFGFRDAGHFYYPLYKRVQQEWQAGRTPRWEQEENSGMPLLGNPTAAVLYPGKLIYALLPYPVAARVYTMTHAALAFVAMLIAMRGWGVSWAGSGLAALGYAFGAPVLFQYCNIIYLVGAAWLPLGFLAVDRWLTQGSRWAILGLAAVLAMQVLGGDPQASYLLGLCAGGYAVGLAWLGSRQRPDSDEPPARPTRRSRLWWMVPAVGVGLVGWATATVALAALFPTYRPSGNPAPALPWMLHVPRVVLLAWVAVCLLLLWRWRTRRWRSPLGVMLLGLASAAVLSALMSAAQLLPVLEFTQQTVRAEGEGPHDIYPFSIEPFRLAELIWPNVTGTSFGRNAHWPEAFRLPGVRQKVWAPSIYLGGLGFVFAAAAFSLRRGPARRVWLSAIVLVSMLGSLGQYTSPIWAARTLAQTKHLQVPDIGPLDTNDVTPIRLDGYLRDGDGGFYWWLSTVLPGFRQFRFPAKLFTFAAFAMAALAGIGWDLLQEGQRRGARWLAALLLPASLGLLGFVVMDRQAIITRLSARDVVSSFGPLDVQAGYAELRNGLAHGAAMLVLALAIIALAKRNRGLAGALVLLGATADLAVANSRCVTVVPQSLFDGEPEVLHRIREAEEQNPAPGPYRIYRMPLWNPPDWLMETADERGRQFVEWERATLQPKYGINDGVEHTHTIGVAEIYEYEWFFGGFPRKVWGQTAKWLGVTPGEEVVYFPRRSFDMWNSRYFILPWFPNGWRDESRGFAAFLEDSELVYPPFERFQGSAKGDEVKAWIQNHDFQIRRNLRAYPRAWVVHEGRSLPPTEGLTRAERSGPIQDMLYEGDKIWNDSTMPIHDPHRLIWIEMDVQFTLRGFLRGESPQASERVKVTYPRPDRAELDVKLEAPGVVVLADAFYPGWKLTIDGTPAPIYRVNRMMRGAAVGEGPHHLVYEYDPGSVRLGGIISVAGLVTAIFLAAFCAVRPRARTLQ
jgi:hypothetical protein